MSLAAGEAKREADERIAAIRAESEERSAALTEYAEREGDRIADGVVARITGKPG